MRRFRRPIALFAVLIALLLLGAYWLPEPLFMDVLALLLVLSPAIAGGFCFLCPELVEPHRTAFRAEAYRSGAT